MAVAKQTINSGGFGRRGAEAPGKVGMGSASKRRPTISARPEARARQAIVETAQSVGEDVSTAARAQGYPGTSSGTAAACDHAYEKVRP